MTQLQNLKLVLGKNLSDTTEDDLLSFFLDRASAIICDLRFSDIVEPQYLGTQVGIAVEFYNKMGAEGQIGHSENGISRSYEKADVSDSILSQITPFARTPYSVKRVIV